MLNAQPNDTSSQVDTIFPVDRAFGSTSPDVLHGPVNWVSTYKHGL
jgi:hypothetical protein